MNIPDAVQVGALLYHLMHQKNVVLPSGTLQTVPGQHRVGQRAAVGTAVVQAKTTFDGIWRRCSGRRRRRQGPAFLILQAIAFPGKRFEHGQRRRVLGLLLDSPPRSGVRT